MIENIGQRRVRYQVEKNLPAFKELSAILSEERYSIIKGLPLSHLAYGSFEKRISKDIDVLISKKSIKRIEDILLNNYFHPIHNIAMNLRETKVFLLSMSHQLYPYIKNYDNSAVLIDINHDIFWGEYEGKRIDIEEFLSDTIEMDIFGVKVKTLPPVKALIQLILHHYKDMNSIFLLATRKSIKYDMFKDVYYLLKNNLDTIPLDELYTMSVEYEIIPYVFYVLSHTGQLFNDEILKQYIEAFRTPEGEALLNCYGLCIKERKKWKCDFQTRLESNDLYSLIKDDLTEKDHEKIAINKRIFLGVSE